MRVSRLRPWSVSRYVFEFPVFVTPSSGPMSTDAILADPVSGSPCPNLRGEPCERQYDGPARRTATRNGGVPGAVSSIGSVAPAVASNSPRTLRAIVADYVQLTKPRIVVMILVTTMASATIAAGHLLSAVDLFWLLLGTAAIAGSAGSANQVWERRIDQRMPRTASRPIPGGRLRPAPSSVFTAMLGTLGLCVLVAKFGLAPAVVGGLTWLVYVLIYTPLKIRTAWNTTVGAVAGALPVLIGYTAAGGGWLDPTGWLLFGVLAAWQYPHFMAIAWMYRRQYADAGFRMTTTVEPTGRSAGLQSVVGSLVLVACGLTLAVIPGGRLPGMIGAVAVVGCSLSMLLASVKFMSSPNDQTARRLLRSSLLVLPAVLAIATLRVFI